MLKLPDGRVRIRSGRARRWSLRRINPTHGEGAAETEPQTTGDTELEARVRNVKSSPKNGALGKTSPDLVAIASTLMTRQAGQIRSLN